jgi:pyruvate,water dikinase
MIKKWTYWLEELGQEHSSLVGKKCANLAEMIRMGLRVPSGFALSVDAYNDFMSMTGTAYRIQDYLSRSYSGTKDRGQFNELSVGISQIIMNEEMPEQLKETIVKYYGELCQRCNTSEVAVSTRSAGPVSHPGQYETYLNVLGESELIDKIKKVWASTFNPRSLASRNRKGVSLVSDPIGVAIQKMVNSKAAGITFTVDPNTGDASRIIIEANWGLGESVVSGEAIPDTYILAKDTLEVKEKRLGLKSKYLTCGELGVTEVETSPEESSAFCLCDEELREIGKLSKVIENHFGVPQDVEWAIDQDAVQPDSIVLLQTRPEVIAQSKTTTDQIIDLMLNRFSGGIGFGGSDI